MRNKTIATVLTLLLLQPGVYANDVLIKCEKSTVNIKVNTTPDKYVNLIVSKHGESVHNNDNIFAMKRTMADADGAAEFSFTMPDEKGSGINGKYDIVIKPDSAEIINDFFVYATNAEKEELMNRIISSQDGSEIGEILEKEENEIILKALGINIDEYIFLEDKSVLLDNIAEEIKSLTENSEIADNINLQISLSYINNAKDTQKHMLIINPIFEEKYFSEVDGEEKEFLIEFINSNRGYISIEEMIEKYKVACILYKINNTRFDKLEEMLLEYATSLGIENADEYLLYKALSSKTSANEKLANSAKTSPFKSASELLDGLKASMYQTSSSSGGTSGSTSGGSSGGSAGGGKTSNTNSVTVTKPVVLNSGNFDDISEAEWAAEAINSMAKNGVVSGDGDGKFHPNREMTREEFIKMLVVAAKLYDEDAKCEFDDVQPGMWYYSFIASAVNSGIAYGVSDSEFGVGNKLTRQDMAVICHRAISKIKKLENIREEKVFSDSQYISGYAKEAVEALYMAGIINGIDENNFAPFDTATRAQGAVLIHNLFFK